MRLESPNDHRDGPAKPAPAAAGKVGWQRVVLLLALLNAPLFFQGCESQKLQFTIGPVVPFAQIEGDEHTWYHAAIVTWSWPKLLANIAILSIGIWLVTRVTWINRVALSRWFLAVLLVTALAFDSWLVWPAAWEQMVLTPQVHLHGLMLEAIGQRGNPTESGMWWTLLLSGRLFYVLLVAGLSVGYVLARLFLRRYFFVRSGSRWQIQLGGLIAAVIVLGTAIGMTVRLLMQ